MRPLVMILDTQARRKRVDNLPYEPNQELGVRAPISGIECRAASGLPTRPALRNALGRPAEILSTDAYGDANDATEPSGLAELEIFWLPS